MLKVILKEEKTRTIELSNVTENTPIFAKELGKLMGMVVFEYGHDTHPLGWILKVGGKLGSDGYHATREECIKSALGLGYELFLEEK
jgi:hypothetical protein